MLPRHFLRLIENTPEHQALYDQALALADAEGEDSPQMALIDFIAEVYNGGVAQYLENGKLDNLSAAISYLDELSDSCPQAAVLSKKLRASTGDLQQAVSLSSHEQRAHQRGEIEDDDLGSATIEFEGTFDRLESWLYANANTDPILQAMVSRGSLRPQ